MACAIKSEPKTEGFNDVVLEVPIKKEVGLSNNELNLTNIKPDPDEACRSLVSRSRQWRPNSGVKIGKRELEMRVDSVKNMLKVVPKGLYLCSLCNSEFSQKHTLKKHVQMLHEKVEDVHKCKDCESTFKWDSSLRRHVLKHHRASSIVLVNCQHCARSFGDNNALQKHVKRVHLNIIGDNLFQCETCSASFKTVLTLRRHVKRIHAEGAIDQYRCVDCDVVFFYKNRYESHMRMSHSTDFDNAKCLDCGQTFKWRHNLTSHRRNVHADTPRLTCLYCFKTFKNKFGMNQHIKFTHSDTPIYKCNICNNTFRWRHTWKRHLERNHGDDATMHKCEQCPAAYVSPDTLRSHRNIKHSGRDPFQCDDCSKTFSRKTALREHIEILHARSPSTFNCKICNAPFKWRRSLYHHMDSEHPKGDTYVTYPCPECGQNFRSKRSMKAHYKSMHLRNMPQYMCDYCGKQYRTKAAIRFHIASAHLSKELKCGDCFAVFKLDRSLESHVANVHKKNGASDLNCDRCTAKFGFLKYLRLHLKAVHGIIKEHYKCKFCKSEYDNKKDFFSHRNAHVELVTCGICTGTYKWGRSYRMHMKIKHNSQVFLLVCNFCDSKFTDRDEHLRHQKQAHGADSFECEQCKKRFQRRDELIKHSSRTHKKVIRKWHQNGEVIFLDGSASNSHISNEFVLPHDTNNEDDTVNKGVIDTSRQRIPSPNFQHLNTESNDAKHMDVALDSKPSLEKVNKNSGCSNRNTENIIDFVKVECPTYDNEPVKTEKVRKAEIL